MNSIYNIEKIVDEWNDIEVHPIFESENGFCEIVPEGQHHFWSVYLKQIDGRSICIADIESKKDAFTLAKLIVNTSIKYQR